MINSEIKWEIVKLPVVDEISWVFWLLDERWADEFWGGELLELLISRETFKDVFWII